LEAPSPSRAPRFSKDLRGVRGAAGEPPWFPSMLDSSVVRMEEMAADREKSGSEDMDSQSSEPPSIHTSGVLTWKSA
jgi:hypothetical protein